MIGVLALCIVVSGCGANVPLQAFERSTSFDPSQDQNKIAAYHRQQAVALRQKVAVLAERARHYERLFGAESDQASGTRALAQYYEDAAQQQEREAEAHAETARTGRPPTP
jgi:hypothetical protein